jgi:hypothetical protein
MSLNSCREIDMFRVLDFYFVIYIYSFFCLINNYIKIKGIAYYLLKKFKKLYNLKKYQFTP